MMTPGAMDPGMMGDVDLMVATMLMAYHRVDATLAQAALTRLQEPELKHLAGVAAQACTSESEKLQAWRERSYPGATMLPIDHMMTMLAGMIQPAVTEPDLQQFVEEVVTSRQQELDQLHAWLQGGADAASAGTPAVVGDVGATVEPDDICFEPKELTIPAGTEVALTLPNEEVTVHNFSIDALGINVDIGPGETKTFMINAPVGSYEYYCNVPGHKPAGMVGALTAQES